MQDGRDRERLVCRKVGTELAEFEGFVAAGLGWRRLLLTGGVWCCNTTSPKFDSTCILINENGLSCRPDDDDEQLF